MIILFLVILIVAAVVIFSVQTPTRLPYPSPCGNSMRLSPSLSFSPS